MSTVPVEAQVDAYRRELIAYCYRFFGCYGEAEDAVQETMVRAWQRSGDFEGRSSLRTWLYRIATNVCLDMKRAPQRRSLPSQLTPEGQTPRGHSQLTTRPEPNWIGPIADSHLASAESVDPADVAALRESIRLTFIAALQTLPPRQRAVLILRDVLAWSAKECAELLDTSVGSVNSALARARATLAESDLVGPNGALPTHQKLIDYDRQLLNDYVAAFEAYDVDRLVKLLAHDAVFSMPPFELWLRGIEEIERWWRGPGTICLNSRTIITSANHQPAVAVYHDTGEGVWDAFALHVLDQTGGRIAAITHFMGPEVFTEFGLPAQVTNDAEPVS